MQTEEHGSPLTKSVAAQPVRGVLYALVQAWEKPATCWNCDRLMAACEMERREASTKYHEKSCL